MEEKGLPTQKRLASFLGVSEGAVNNWVLGVTRPAPATLQKMADAASEPLAAFFKQEIRDYVWHRKRAKAHMPIAGGVPKGKLSRYSEATRQQLHTALDLILDNAPSTVIETMTAFLVKHAGVFEGPGERPSPPQAPSAKKGPVHHDPRGSPSRRRGD
jgi:hypothetical protein